MLTNSLFALKPARSAAFDLLLEMARGCQDNFLEIQKLLMKHHSSGKSSFITRLENNLLPFYQSQVLAVSRKFVV